MADEGQGESGSYGTCSRHWFWQYSRQVLGILMRCAPEGAIELDLGTTSVWFWIDFEGQSVQKELQKEPKVLFKVPKCLKWAPLGANSGPKTKQKTRSRFGTDFGRLQGGTVGDFETPFWSQNGPRRRKIRPKNKSNFRGHFWRILEAKTGPKGYPFWLQDHTFFSERVVFLWKCVKMHLA